MPVTDAQVATLRAQLSGSFEEHRRLLAQLDQKEAASGYTALITAACFEAIEERFVKDGKIVDEAAVIEFVGSLRARTEAAAEEVDPRIAERLILHSLGKGSMSDVPKETRIRTQLFVLVGLISEAHFNEAQLDTFMSKVRRTAEEWVN